MPNSATLLPNGKVYVVGGNSRLTADLYDSSTGSWSETAGGAVNDVYYCASALLPNGKVLTLNLSGDGYWYNPTSDTYAYLMGATGAMYEGFRLTPLANGKVLVTGYGPTNAAVYDPTTGTNGSMVPAGQLAQGRAYHSALLLPNGQVLVAGGSASPGPYGDPVVASAELYNPGTNTFAAVPGSMVSERSGHAAVLLLDGKVWISGGKSTAAPAVASADTYRPR